MTHVGRLIDWLYFAYMRHAEYREHALWGVS